MSKHTPGPWEWVGSNLLYGGQRGYDEILAARDDGKPYGMHSALIDHHWNQEQAIANARLIASAPDLLEALKALTHSLDEGELLHDDQRNAFAASLKAISKETGETK